MQGHFRYLRFKTFSMTPRTPQCKVFWAFLSRSKHSGVPKDSKSPTLEVLGFTPTLGQSGYATDDGICCAETDVKVRSKDLWQLLRGNERKSKSKK
jgi:hypothetical protein